MPELEAITATTRAAAQGGVRPLRREDLPAIGRLFEDVFFHRSRAAPPSQLAHLADIYLDHPWHDPATPSLVFESDDGAVDGFVGVLPLRLRYRDHALRGAVAGSLMVRNAAAQPMAGARLLRAFLKGPQDISFGDTTNAVSEGLWRRLGGRSLPLASMEFVKIVRPARFAANVAANRLPWHLGSALGPVGGAVDGMARLIHRPVQGSESWRDETVGDEDFIAALRVLSRVQSLSLDLDTDAARWLLRQAALKQKHGPLHRRVVRDRAGKTIGAYLIYAQRGQPAELLQSVQDAKAGDAMLASMAGFVDRLGGSAVRGRAQAGLMPALFRAGCLMRHRSFTVIDTHDPVLLAAAETASFGGFFGETWTRITSDDFRRDAMPAFIAPTAALQPITAA